MNSTLFLMQNSIISFLVNSDDGFPRNLTMAFGDICMFVFMLKYVIRLVLSYVMHVFGITERTDFHHGTIVKE